MRLYGEANDLPGLATGPIETRFDRLRQHAEAESLVVFTTPVLWAAGEGLILRFPELRLDFACSLEEGHLQAGKIAHVGDDARPPEREPGAVGVVLQVEHILLPPEDARPTTSDPGVDLLERHFGRLAGKRWGGFVEPLRAALEAEAREDEARTQRLTVSFKGASLLRGGEEDVWKLQNVAPEALRALDDGEWLELLDDQKRSRASARVIDMLPSQSVLEVGVRAADPPSSGYVRPRSRRKILDQKRALLEELANPTGSLPNLVRLVAAPGSMPVPSAERPESFINQAVMRNRSQSRAVALALGLEDGEAMLIQGPPGTGKSTTAAEIDVQLLRRDPDVRILVCSHSNHGTDNMLMKVLPFLDEPEERIARIGFYERIAKEARPYYAPPDADLGDKSIVFTTIDALVLQDVAGARVYDYVILDEANRAGVLDSLLALARGRRMVLVGDPMQLQPVMSEAEQQLVSAALGRKNGKGGKGGKGGRRLDAVKPPPGPNNVIGKSLFAWIMERRFAPAATVLLDQQNRMHPAIGELVSRVFYSGRVRTGPAAPRRGTGLPLFPSPATWVDTRSLRGNAESRAGGTSIFNVAEARLVTTLTRYLASQAPPGLTIGVITAYAEQRELLRRLMGPHDWPPEREIEIDTVDAFEGREKDIIVLSLVRSNRRRDIGFLRLEQRLNVAVSRARRLLVIVGDTSTLRTGYFHTLISTAASVGQIIAAPKLIGQITHRGQRGRRERLGRRRDGREAQPVPAVVGEEEQVEAESPETEAVAAGTAVEPVDTDLGETRRRRRRRAWERRRERRLAARAQAEANGQTAADAEPEEAAPGEPGPAELEPKEAAPEAAPAPTRRPRRRLTRPARATAEPETASPGESEPTAAPVETMPVTAAEPAVAAEMPPVVAEPESAPKRRPVRRKTFAATEPPVQVAESVAIPAVEIPPASPLAEPDGVKPRRAPRRRTTATTPAEAAEPVAETPATSEPVAETSAPPKRPARRRSTAKTTETGASDAPEAPAEAAPAVSPPASTGSEVLALRVVKRAADEPPAESAPAPARSRRTTARTAKTAAAEAAAEPAESTPTRPRRRRTKVTEGEEGTAA